LQFMLQCNKDGVVYALSRSEVNDGPRHFAAAGFFLGVAAFLRAGLVGAGCAAAGGTGSGSATSGGPSDGTGPAGPLLPNEPPISDIARSNCLSSVAMVFDRSWLSSSSQTRKAAR